MNPHKVRIMIVRSRKGRARLWSTVGAIRSRVTVATGAEPLRGSFLASIGVLLLIRTSHKATRKNVLNLGRQSRGRVSTKLTLLTLILLDETTLVGLGHVLTTLSADLVDRPKNDLLRGTVARAAVLGEVADVATGDIGRTIDGECNAIRDLTAPSLSVETGLVPRSLARIHMDPTTLVFRIHLSPDVVFRVPYPTNAGSDSTAEHAEAIGPFSHTAPACLQQLPDIRVTGESLIGTTVGLGAAVQLDTGGATGGLVGAGGCHALSDRGHTALGAWGVIDELEEGVLEPPAEQGMLVWAEEKVSMPNGGLSRVSNVLQQCPNHTILISPFRLSSHAGRLSLHDLRFLFGLGIETVQRKSAQSLVEETGVFILGRRHRQSL
jgi:hypothetical protein